MLWPAEAALVARDDRVPALGLLLDTAALQGWLAAQTGRACTVAPRRLRYKPGTSCVLAFDLVTESATTTCVAKAYAEEAAAKTAKSVRSARRGTILAHAPSAHLLVTTLAADRDLPALAELADARARPRLLGEVLGDVPGDVLGDVPGEPHVSDPAAAPSSMRTLRYNPERRWVGTLGSADGAVVLRAYRRDTVDRHATAYAALHGQQRPSTPRLLGASRHHAFTAVQWVPGRVLTTACSAADFAAAGAALAQLHGLSTRPLAPQHAPEPARAVRAAAAQVGVLLPHLRAGATGVADRVITGLGRIEQQRVVLHGDFSADQVVIGAAGTAALIDLDSVGAGDPAADLGCAAAALLAEDGTADDAPRGGCLDALHAGYAEWRPLPPPDSLAVHTAGQLLRRTGEAFRRRQADWPQRAHRLLARAEDELASTSGAHR